MLDIIETCVTTVCSLRYWFRAKGKLSDDQALHRYICYIFTLDLSGSPSVIVELLIKL